MTTDIDVAVIGAGPYGLACAAHLRASGRQPVVFGRPLEFWRTQAPAGMVLRSPYAGSSIGDPDGKLTIAEYERRCAEPITRPIPVDRFIDYGQWFQQHAVPDVDVRQVDRLERRGAAWSIRAGADGFTASCVVVAAGIGTMGFLPDPLAGVTSAFVSHTLDHDSLAGFADRRVAVVGGGQSALESAALLAEFGARPVVVMRRPSVRWLGETARRHTMPGVAPLLYAKPDVGPAFVSHLVAHPSAFAMLPRRTQDRLAARSVRPAGANWLRDRLAGVPIRTGVSVAAVQPGVDTVAVTLSDGSTLEVDHVVAGTGYRMDLSRYRFLDADVRRGVACVGGYPELSRGFETSVPGLHIVGAPAARRFGPLMRFVAGSDFAGRSVTRDLRR